MNRALVSLALFASLLTTGCATTSSNAALAGVNTVSLERDELGLSRRDERTARAAAQPEHHDMGGTAGRR